MTQASAILALLRDGPKSLKQFAASPAGIFYELRSRLSEMRAQGYKIDHHKVIHCKSCPMVDGEDFYDPVGCPAWQRGEAVYVLSAEPPVVCPNGQRAFLA